MPKQRLDVGVTVDFLNSQELGQELQKNQDRAEAMEREKLKGVKYTRLPRLYATPAAGTVVLGEAWIANGTVQLYTDQTIGPSSGYVMSVRRLACNGLGTSDTLNIYRNGIHSDPVWQLSGSVFFTRFGKTELVLLPGENLVAAQGGSLVSTNQITLTGDAVQVPAEYIGKLIS